MPLLYFRQSYLPPLSTASAKDHKPKDFNTRELDWSSLQTRLLLLRLNLVFDQLLGARFINQAPSPGLRGYRMAPHHTVVKVFLGRKPDGQLEI